MELDLLFHLKHQNKPTQKFVKEWLVFKNLDIGPGVVANFCNGSTQEAEAGRSQAQGQPGYQGLTM
jgi:hypothetical protein